MAQDEASTPALRVLAADNNSVSAAQAIANAALTEALTTHQHQQQRREKNSNADATTTITGEEGQEGDNGNATNSSFPRSSHAVLRKKQSSRNHGDDDDTDKNNGYYEANDDHSVSDKKESGGVLLQDKLKTIWNFIDDNNEEDDAEAVDLHQHFEEAYQATLSLIVEQLDSITQEGMQAFRQLAQVKRELTLSKDLVDSKERELKRLRDNEAHQRSTIENLVRALGKTKRDANDASKAAMVESQLRSEIQSLMTAKDKAVEDANESKRKHELLQGDLEQTKTKLAKVEQDKVKLERDRNATMTWARSVDNHVNSDSDFYKRKVSEQNIQIQSLNAVVHEKTCQIEDLRRQLDRSRSTNRLAQLGTSQTTARGTAKKARKRSY
ncbi:expressed unknown protein [Seminavis robusta]|uniref:Uncharacterized protein n=1 Tax=Seminavis robusta TaxID=568900 RepID=A0A9N8HNV8_9STRA|nr:expressed unknown protein [Seminavis robusta]|eukprot:Sro1121_g243460.1 n/a (383) ;mRNA; f:32343-33625